MAAFRGFFGLGSGTIPLSPEKGLSAARKTDLRAVGEVAWGCGGKRSATPLWQAGLAVRWGYLHRGAQSGVTLYIGIQTNAQDHGMLADLREAISGLKAPYREAWLEEATPYRWASALMRFDSEWLYWQAVQQGVVENVLQGWRKGEPFPDISVIRPNRRDRE